MDTMNISLPEPMKKFIEEEVSRGGYSTVSEYIRAILREEQKRKAREELEALLMDGLKSGEATEMTEEDWNKIRRNGLARLKARKSSRTIR